MKEDQDLAFDLDVPPREVLRQIGEKFLRRQKDPRFLALLRVIVGESERFPELARSFNRKVILPGIEAFKTHCDRHPEYNIENPEAMARVFVGALANYIVQQEILYCREIMPFNMEHLRDYLINVLIAKVPGYSSQSSK
jgi:hypothetical protein